MRELRFRVWDKEAGEYLEGEDAKAFVLKQDGTHYVEMTFGYYDKGKDWVIEQSTGLKDKNGKEIYEGDIVECDYCNENHLISWCSNCACFESWRSDKTPCLMFGESHEELHYKAIGNIHENPELMEEEE